MILQRAAAGLALVIPTLSGVLELVA